MTEFASDWMNAFGRPRAGGWLLGVVFAGAALPGVAQSAAARAGVAGTKASAVSALFLSDIHFDPYADPALVTKLDAEPAAQWHGILEEPASATKATDAAALGKACPVRGADTSETLWDSSLGAIRNQTTGNQAAGDERPKFVVIAGDFLAHDFDCKYKSLLPTHTHEQFLAFAANTLRYIFASLRTAVPGVPVYAALGNNDTACGGNKLEANDDFLRLVARIVADQLELGEGADQGRQPILRDIASGGFYSLRMAAPMQNTRLLVLDDIFYLTEFSTCSGQKDYSEETAQIAWLKAQLAEARARHEKVWVLGHIVPGIALYSTLLTKHINICGGDAPSMALDSTALSQVLADNADIIRLGLFGHTHFDEMALIQPGLGETPPPPGSPIGVPIKFIPSISPINFNNPTFTLAKIDPVTSTLVDYTTFASSNRTGVDAKWTKEYSYSAAYGEPDFAAASVEHLIAGFHADRTASTDASQAYLRNFFAGNISFLIAPLWPTYVCAMDHQTGAGFSACVCPAAAK
jgi:sphingomyelin phosphodiesterase acid-like 3